MWFLQLSGWPVFLAIVVGVAAFMIAASVALTWIGNRSLVQAMVIVTLALTLLALVVLVGFVLLTRANV
jgi:hypothetical protein